MQSSVEHSHPSVDIAEAGRIIHKLHEQVCGDQKRVHLTRANCDDTCVMISCKELESLERAIGIFADTKEFSGICQALTRLLESAGAVFSAPVSDEAA